jgi:amino acid adenylation domain-containing protein
LRLYICEDKHQERWLLMLLHHHIIDDNTSFQRMQEEIQSRLLGHAEPPPPLPFRNLVAQAQLGVSQEEHEAYFRSLLGDVDEPTAPFGLVDVRRDGTGIEEASLELDKTLARRVRQGARNMGVSAASICHLAYGLVIAKVSGRSDVVFGTVLFGRMQAGAGQRALGLFINTLPFRIDVGRGGVEHCVRRAHVQLGDLLHHEHASLALAQRCSSVPAPIPLFSALLNYRHNPARASLADTNRVSEGVECLCTEGRTNYPFALFIDDFGDEFQITAQTVASVDPKRICGYMETALKSLVEALEKAPESAVCRLEVMPKEEREQLLVEWNRTEAEYPRENCVHELFEEQVRKTPEAAAVVFEDGHISYAELNRRANQLARYLQQLGVRPDVTVAICVERSLEMVVGVLAILKAGGAYVPMDPSFPDERLRYMLRDSEPGVLLVQGQVGRCFADTIGSVRVVDLEKPDWWTEGESNIERHVIGLTSGHLAYVIYTSGSTGNPKGVMISHSALGNFLRAMQRELGGGPDDVWLAITNLCFDIAGLELYFPLMLGGRLRMLGREASVDGVRLLKELGYGVTTAQATPAGWRVLLEAQWEGTRGLKVLCGGEALNADLAGKLVDRSTVAWNMYGPTETTIWSLMHRLDQVREGVPIGRPIANTRVYILDADQEPAPVGVMGELYIGGEGLARGYFNRAELTAERFMQDPFARVLGARMYRSGDLGRWRADGAIDFLGRNDFQVKVRGFRIELGEIEAALERLPGVQQAAVLAWDDKSDERQLVAYVVGRADPTELRQALKGHLPEYMIPGGWIQLQEMPLTHSGKLDRKRLPTPSSRKPALDRYVAPRSATEEVLAEIWLEVLQIERVGVYDNFFDSGGHSLSAMRVVSRIRETLFVDISLRSLFEAPTVAELSEIVTALEPRRGQVEEIAKFVRLVQERTANA